MFLGVLPEVPEGLFLPALLPYEEWLQHSELFSLKVPKQGVSSNCGFGGCFLEMCESGHAHISPCWGALPSLVAVHLEPGGITAG